MKSEQRKEKNVTFTIRIPLSLKRLIDKNALEEGRTSANLGAFYLKLGVQKKEQAEKIV